MTGFSDIIGHDQIITQLKHAVVQGKVSHAYLFHGEKDSGKRMLAETFAMALQCERPQQGEPCMECRSCKQALGKNQPDIIYVTHEKKALAVDDVREQINRDIILKPYSSKYKVYIVDEAEKMNVQAQNALLKTLEEPPAYALILLLTTNSSAFLPTIRSRCVTLDLRAVPDQRIRDYLMRQYQVPDYQADLCVAFAQGNVGRAIRLASSERFGEVKDRTLQLMRRLDTVPGFQFSQELEFLQEDTENIPYFFDLLLLLFRDVLLYKATAATEQLLFQGQEHIVQQLAQRISFAGLQCILTAVHTAKQRLHSNVSEALTLELLLFDIKENIA